jgi:hypothetical protein
MWRDFFTDLNSTNKSDVCKLAEAMERLFKMLEDHDARAKEIKIIVEANARSLHRRPSDKPKTNDRQYIPEE